MHGVPAVLQYTSLLKTVSGELDLDVSSSQLQRLTDAPVGAARDALSRQRRDTIVLVKDSLKKMKDDVRRKSETIERSENNLLELRFAAVVFYRSL